jgi:hypothetical protein
MVTRKHQCDHAIYTSHVLASDITMADHYAETCCFGNL